MRELKSEAFGGLVIEAIKNSGKSKYEIVKTLSSTGNAKSAQYSDRNLLTKPHRITWSLRICDFLNIDALQAYKAILQDRDLLKYNNKELMQYAPKEYLSAYRFANLRLNQLLQEIQELEDTGTDSEIIKAKIAECRQISAKQSELMAIVNDVLNAGEAEALVLRYFEGFSIREISEATGKGVRWLNQLLARALKKISLSNSDFASEVMLV